MEPIYARTFIKLIRLIEKLVAFQGLDDPEVLPKNYFRDDALKLWNIIKEFVASILGIYYCCDDVDQKMPIS